MIKYLIAITLLMFCFSSNASELNGGKDKWPNGSSTKKVHKLPSQTYLNRGGLDYKRLHKNNKRAKRRKLRRGPCNGAH